MALSMARPMRRKGTAFHQLRKRIPQDVLHRARGLSLTVPVGDAFSRIIVGPKSETIAVSLRTRDPREAKERQAVALAYLDSFWQSLRTGPVSLTHKQTVALAGEVYRALVAAFEDNPGPSGTWESIIRLHARALAGDAAALEQWYGPTVDEVLARHRLVINAESRSELLVRVGVTLAQAAERLRQNAGGDYGPDPVVDRFPEFTRPSEPASIPVSIASSAQTITGLVDGWWREAKIAGLAISTYEAYERAARQFTAFLGHDCANAVTEDDVIRFKDHRIAQGASLKTVGDSDLAGLRKLFNWGLDNRKVRDNPVRGVKVIAPKKARTRPKGFTDEEATLLLSHAWHHKRGRESAKICAAKRWLPWLCAYTGARIGEMAQLRKQDLRAEAGGWVITITPEAGTVKDKEFREVPLHTHLVELGFLAFVEASANGFLFLSPLAQTDEAFRGTLQTVKNRVRDFVREVITDSRVAPNHGWRHRFMSVGRNLDIPRDVRFSITGHAGKESGDEYGDVFIKARAAAIAKFPRFAILTPAQLAEAVAQLPLLAGPPS